jgi:ABC-2 type transport system ATP-binding protein
MYMIHCDQVTLSYDGRRDAVSSLSFKVERGSIFALVGPNGAGKTSTLRMLATLLPPTSGEIKVDGYDVCKDREEVCRRIGFLPDHFALYEHMTPVELLDFFACCHDVPAGARRERIEQLIDELDLGQARSSSIRSLSRGTRQRLGMAKTLVHEPKVLILDEPASALDPNARVRLQSTLLRLKKRGLAILISSHILPELADIADAVGIIDHGRAVYVGPLEQAELPEEAIHTLEVARPQKARPVLESFDERLISFFEVGRGRFELTIRGGDETVGDLVEKLVLRGARVTRVAPRASRLEVVYQASMCSTVSQENAS